MKITICGDISARASESLFAQKNTKALFTDTVNVFKDSDEVIVNLECAVTDKDTPIKKMGPNLKAPFGTVEVLKEIGTTVAAISNNHIFDFGKAGIEDTLNELKKNGIQYTGFGENEEKSRENFYFQHDGKTVAIVNVCEHEYSYALKNRMGARPYDPYDTNDDIVTAKNNADFVIVIYHGGKEHVRYPSNRLVKACHSMVTHGADVVLCQHSHCIGCEEYYKGGYILYGQGNFHFVYNRPTDTEMWTTGLIIVVNINKDKFTIDRIPIVIDGLGIRLANDSEKERLLNELVERSKSIVSGEYEQLFEQNCQKFTRGYNIVSDENKELFAHYFDCEAHTDVCKVLYKTYNKSNELDD